jgi:mono/diheme cytochrome c family protein
MRLTTLIGGAVLVSVTGHSAAAELTGPEVFERHCVHCHGPGNEAVGTLQLARTRGQDKALLTERKDLPPEYIRIVVRHGLRAMPAFVPSDLTDAQLQALTEYLTNKQQK